jgi:hypothetical protein
MDLYSVNTSVILREDEINYFKFETNYGEIVDNNNNYSIFSSSEGEKIINLVLSANLELLVNNFTSNTQFPTPFFWVEEKENNNGIIKKETIDTYYANSQNDQKVYYYTTFSNLNNFRICVKANSVRILINKTQYT